MPKVSLCLLMILLLPVTLTEALTVDVFTTTTLGVRQSVVLEPLPKTANVNVFKVDQLKQLQDGLNQIVKSTVPTGDNKAFKKTAIKWIALHKKAYKKVASAVQGIYRDKIADIPAIVFNHRYAVLGTTDLNQAYQIYLNKVGNKYE